MSDLVNYSIFDPLIPYIKVIGSNGYIRIEVPKNLTIDIDEIMKYFTAETSFVCERGKPENIVGFLKDKSVADYLSGTSLTVTVKWGPIK